MTLPIKEAFWYTLGSGVALAVDITLLTALVEYCRWPTLVAATVSFSFGILVIYAFSVRLAFNHRRIQDRRIEFSTFAAIGAAGIGINAGAIYFASEFLAFNLLTAKCVASGFTFGFNFIARRHALFSRPRRVSGIKKNDIYR